MAGALLAAALLLAPGARAQQEEADYAAADKQLNAVWAKLKSALPAEAFAEVRDSQRGWLEFRGEPDFSTIPAAELKEYKKEYFASMARITRDRAAWLRGKLPGAKVDDISGEWSDTVGGQLKLALVDGKLYFALFVVRGPTAHLGAINGVAVWDGKEGTFSDRGLVPDKKEDTKLTFSLKGAYVTVGGENTMDYHGMRAYFDGQYGQTAVYTDEEKAAFAKKVNETDDTEIVE